MNIVLVHGIFDNGRFFKPMVRALEQQGHHCLVPSLKPADARRGIDDLARKLARYLDDALDPAQSFALIGFSMGGVIARQYLQALGGRARVLAFFAISAPFQGTWSAYCYPGQGARDMRPGSALLTQLAATESVLQDLPLFTYRTRLDLTILPSRSSAWAMAENHLGNTPLHRWMLRDRTVRADIVSRLAWLTPDAAS
ncbi:MAG: alpha/beta fold hydrolase [Pseudomonas sp.]|uniref:esterase/lipase family protein n=1 Tax=Pseudomonas sp. TaxID=306 RepID=UPI00339087A0